MPATAILVQLSSSTCCCSASFEAVLEFIQFSLTFCSFLTVLGVIVLRVTRPDLPRPYRTWGYPVTPFVFLGVTLFMMYYLLTERPVQSLPVWRRCSRGWCFISFTKNWRVPAPLGSR